MMIGYYRQEFFIKHKHSRDWREQRKMSTLNNLESHKRNDF